MNEWVITLIGKPLTEEAVHATQKLFCAKRIEWLHNGVACDLYVDRNALGDAHPIDALGGGIPGILLGIGLWIRNLVNQSGQVRKIHTIAQDERIDFILQPAAKRRKKLLICDMDSTMIQCECIDELADFVGKKAEVSAITERAMNGELNFESALTERVALLKGLPESTLQQCYDERVRMMPGAKELVQTMRNNGAHCVLVSGGFTFFTSRVAAELGFHEHFSNTLEIENGMLTGRVIPPILGKEAKLKTLWDMCFKLDISSKDVLAIGDGANDLPMLLAAGLGVAYHAKPAVQAAAKHRINHNDLSALIWVTSSCESR